MGAATASECAREQGKFWEMHDVIFENQRQIGAAKLEEYAGGIEGLDAGKWKTCFSSNKHKNRIQADQRTATSLGARGTPAFFVNGRFLSGAQPFNSFKTVIDEELKKAKASGIPKNEYYAKAVMAKGAKKL